MCRRALLHGFIGLLVLCDLLCVGVSGGRVGFGVGIGDCLYVTVGSSGGVKFDLGLILVTGFQLAASSGFIVDVFLKYTTL